MSSSKPLTQPQRKLLELLSDGEWRSMRPGAMKGIARRLADRGLVRVTIGEHSHFYNQDLQAQITDAGQKALSA